MHEKERKRKIKYLVEASKGKGGPSLASIGERRARGSRDKEVKRERKATY